MKRYLLFTFLLGLGFVGIFMAVFRLPVSAPPPPPPCNCESRLADLDKKCTDAMARQVALLRSCEMRCPEPDATP